MPFGHATKARLVSKLVTAARVAVASALSSALLLDDLLEHVSTWGPDLGQHNQQMGEVVSPDGVTAA
jgi:hypothetical protein